VDAFLYLYPLDARGDNIADQRQLVFDALHPPGHHPNEHYNHTAPLLGHGCIGANFVSLAIRSILNC
jgi:hypothetical protein